MHHMVQRREFKRVLYFHLGVTHICALPSMLRTSTALVGP